MSSFIWFFGWHICVDMNLDEWYKRRSIQDGKCACRIMHFENVQNSESWCHKNVGENLNFSWVLEAWLQQSISSQKEIA